MTEAKKIVHGWSTECGSCGHGSGGWRNSPALSGGEPIFSDTTECPGCGATFTEAVDVAPKNLSPARKLLWDD